MLGSGLGISGTLSHLILTATPQSLSISSFLKTRELGRSMPGEPSRHHEVAGWSRRAERWPAACPGCAQRREPLSMGILHVRRLEWVAMPSSRGSSQPRDDLNLHRASQVALLVKNLPANAGDIRDTGPIPGLDRKSTRLELQSQTATEKAHRSSVVRRSKRL